MIVYYENSKGKRLNLLKSPYRTVDADWYNADWEKTSDGYELVVDIDVFGKRSEFQANMERLYNIIAVDSELGVYGKLYVNGTYLRCQIRRSEKSGWKGYIYSEVELVFLAPELEWIQEISKGFFPQPETGAESGIDFPFDFSFDFSSLKRGYDTLNVDHITSSDFQMVIYGPCTNPRILINDNPYEVNVSLEKNEYLIIDSRTHTVMKYLSNGTTQSCFDDRGLEYSVFNKIPAGMLSFNWSGDFGFDLILFLKRREAKW